MKADVNVYEACDKAIREMNRENLRVFGQLKLARWEEIKILNMVMKMYRDSARKARKRYYEIAFEAYLLAMAMCRVAAVKAHAMAEEAIDEEWIEYILTQPDPVTLYKFNTETERKAVRLAEALEEAPNRNMEIDKALRLWSRQLGQYAINFTDYAMIQAFKDAGIEMVEWIAVMDGRECHECHAYNGQVFRIDEIPRKPHWGCRCRLRPVFRTKKAQTGAEAKT